MTITTFLDPSQLPKQTQDQQTFDTLMGGFMQLLPTWGAQVNGTLASINTTLAGGAYAIPYVFSTTTTDADPGAGNLRLDNATQNTAATIRLDTTGMDLVDYTSIIDTFDASTSTTKGAIRIIKMQDPTKFLLFSVTARAAPTGYRNVSVTPVGGSSASPFANGDSVMLFFQRNGDAGAGATMLLPNGVFNFTTSVSTINFLNVFSATYDKYVIEVQGVGATPPDTLMLRVAKAGVAEISGYWNGVVGSATAMSSGAAIPVSNATSIKTTTTITIRNANNADGATAKGIEAMGHSWITGGSYIPVNLQSAFINTAALSGFQLYWASGATFTSGTIRVYGVKNS